MARSEKQKLKLLILKDYLESSSDENNTLSAQALVEELERHGITAERKSIYSDMDCLREYGMDVELKRGRSGGYYLASRDFELPELKLLVDAVQSSRFLTYKKSMELIAKLEKQVSRFDAGRLRREVVVSGRVKNMDESIYYKVDALHEAIAGNSQITFRYFKWGADRKRHYRKKDYIASPYALVWDSENYYLVAHSEQHGLTHYRVDRMESITQTGKHRDMTSYESMDISRYGKNVFSMYHGEEVDVKMRFASDLAGVVLDRFGHDSMLIPDGPDFFTVTEKITVSDAFLSWLTQFGNEAKILHPESVVQAHRELLRKTLAQYE